jgi:hypothetical protein
VLPWPSGPPTIRPPVVDVSSRFMSLEPGPRSSRVSESVRLPVGRFVSVRGLEEGTLSVKFQVRDSRRPGPVALTPLHRMDTVVRVAEGTQLQDLTKAKAAKVKRLRWAVLIEEWQPQPRDTTIDARFWTVLQASFYESYCRRGHRLFSHRVLDWESISQQAGGADIKSHFAHFGGLPGLLEVGQNRYIED